MSGPNYPAVQSPVAIISRQFCLECPVDLTIVRKTKTLSEGSFGVTDVNGNLMFKVKDKVFSLHDRRVLLDSAGDPIITFQGKLSSVHERWVAFRGKSRHAKDLLFSVRKSSLFQMETKLYVFLASNTAEETCDFKIEGSESSCVIYAGDSNDNIIAQMHRNLLGKDSFGVTVYPTVDHAFIVALVVLFEEIRTTVNLEEVINGVIEISDDVVKEIATAIFL